MPKSRPEPRSPGNALTLVGAALANALTLVGASLANGRNLLVASLANGLILIVAALLVGGCADTAQLTVAAGTGPDPQLPPPSLAPHGDAV